MAELLSRLRSEDLVVVVLFLLCFLAGLTVWLSLQWRLHRRSELEGALKQDMLNRGMSAEDIERVLRASSRRTEMDGVIKLIARGMSLEDIERVLRASSRPVGESREEVDAAGRREKNYSGC